MRGRVQNGVYELWWSARLPLSDTSAETLTLVPLDGDDFEPFAARLFSAIAAGKPGAAALTLPPVAVDEDTEPLALGPPSRRQRSRRGCR